jgi:hypothetical protein
LATCDGPLNIGMVPGIPGPTHGTIIVSPQTGPGNQTVTYNHNGNSATSDTFVLEDENGDTLTFNVTITPPASPIVVSPLALPTSTAGTAFSQTLTSSGGLAPYSYSLQSGTLPVGLTLSGGGVISGTPTQRGGYAFTVRSTDSTSPTAQFVDKGYTGTVQNPTLSITPTTATAIQSVPFSQTLAITGGVAPHSCLLETGTFPAGISVSSGCVISGTTTAAAGNYPVTIRVTDASTGPGVYFELEPFTLTVSPPPSVTIAVSPASVSEDGETNLTYTVTRTLNLSSPTTVSLAIGGTATNGTDYATIANTVTIPAGALSASVIVDPSVDGTVEADESVILTVIAGTGYTVQRHRDHPQRRRAQRDHQPHARECRRGRRAESGLHRHPEPGEPGRRDFDRLHHRRHGDQRHRLRDDHFAAGDSGGQSHRHDHGEPDRRCHDRNQ